MACFTDPLDSVLAAIEIQKALHQYNARLSAEECIEVKIGINTGRVIEHGSDLIGPAVNEAARVQAKARPKEILITQTTYGLVKDCRLFLCVRKGTRKLKGVSTPINVYTVRW